MIHCRAFLKDTQNMFSWQNKKKCPFEPVHDKAYNKACVTSEDSDQSVHLHI